MPLQVQRHRRLHGRSAIILREVSTMLFLPATRRALPVSFARHFDALFDDAFEPFFRAGEATRAPSMDIAESDSAYTVTLDVPGTAREQLKVSIEGKR